MATTAIATLAVTTTATAQRSATRRTTSSGGSRQVSIEPRTTGLMLGVQTIAAPGVSVSGEDVDGTFSTSFGGGAGLMIGYGFNRTFSSYVSLDLAKQRTGSEVEPAGTFGLAHFEVGARANLPIGSPTTLPYLSASVGRRALGARVSDAETNEHFDFGLSGTMLALGGGVQHFISPSLALDGGVEIGFGRFGHLNDDGDQSDIQVSGSTSTRLRFGLIWRP